METNSSSWQERFGLTTCLAAAIDPVIPADARGVAVIYRVSGVDEEIFLVIESRAGSLRAQCERRLTTAKLPPLSELTVSFLGEALADATPEALKEICRQQVYLAGELRRELRPAMR